MTDNSLPPKLEIERSPLAEATKLGNETFQTPEKVADMVELSVEHTPVLLPRKIHPCQCSKLTGGGYAIFNAGYPFATIGKDWWNVPEWELKIHRARFLLQRDTFYQDLMIQRRDYEARQANPDAEPQFRRFRYYTGAQIIQPPSYVVNKEIVPLYFPKGVWVPGANSTESQKLSNLYRYADGTIETTISF